VVGQGAPSFALARERAVSLRMIGEARLCVPERVVMRPGGVIVATMPRIDGIDLDALLERRGHLLLGECVYLGEQLCGAIASLHERGLAHGDLSPANVMLSRRGVHLVDTVGGALPTEVGTRGYRAPERSLGATAAADVYSVGAILAACVDPAVREEFMGWLDPLLDNDPARRPQARGVEAGLGQCAPAVPIHLPDAGLVGELRAHAREPRERTSALRSSRAWRLRRSGLRVTVVGAAALVVIGITAYLIPRADSAAASGVVVPSAAVKSASTAASSQPTPVVIPDSVEASQPAVDAARALTNDRFAALVAADAPALLATGATDSPMGVQLQAQARELATGDLRFVGVTATVIATQKLPVSDTEDLARVSVTYVVSAHTVWRRDAATGIEDQTHVDAHREVANLELVRDGTTWLVARALPQS